MSVVVHWFLRKVETELQCVIVLKNYNFKKSAKQAISE